MADNEGLPNGDRSVEITDESSKDSGLTQRLYELESDKGRILEENDGYKKQLEKLKVEAEKLRRDNQDLQDGLQELESDKKVLQAVADRAAGLEADVSRLQLDLGFAMSNLQESMAEIDALARELERVTESEKKKDAKLAAVTKERDILSSKIVELEGVENGLKIEKQQKETEIQTLKKSIEELQGATESTKRLEKTNASLGETMAALEEKINVLDSNLQEKEKLIRMFELEQRTHVKGSSLDEQGIIRRLEKNRWIILGGSTITALGVASIACYLRAAKKT